MKTSMILGMSHKIILQLASVALLAAAGTGTAETITINAYSEMRYDAYNWDGVNNIGVYGPPSAPNNYATLFYVYGPDQYQESRTVWQFKLDELGLTTDDVLSATVKWGSTTPWGGAYILGIDVVNSDFTTWNNTPMYGFEANGVTFGGGLLISSGTAPRPNRRMTAPTRLKTRSPRRRPPGDWRCVFTKTPFRVNMRAANLALSLSK